MLQFGKRSWIGYVIAALIALLAMGLRYAVEPALQGGYPFVTFFPAVALAGYLLGLRPALVTVALSAVLSWIFLVEGADKFAYDLSRLAALVLFVTFSTIIVLVLGSLQRANLELAREREANLALVAHREVLFRELQHRVGNNIQMIASLISLQQRRIQNPAAQEALQEAGRRLGLVGRIHRKLYDPAGGHLDLATFIDQIAKDVVAASGRQTVRYRFEGCGEIVLPGDKAIPTALIIAEALNNALEHGFPGDAVGNLRIAVQPTDQGVSVTIADDGVGLSPGFDAEASESLGLKIACTLAKSLGGRFTMANSPAGQGTIARLEISAPQSDDVQRS